MEYSVSTLKTNTIQAATGSTVNVASGNVLNAPGHVIQVVQVTSNTQFTMNSTSYAATPLVLTITPSSTSSKILINFNTCSYANGSGTFSVFDIFRGTVSGTSLSGAASYGLAQNYSGSNGSPLSTVSGMVLDSPNTTSETTYTVGLKRAGSSANVTANENSSLGTITAMEIAQ